ncbi:hypothetical protein [Novosphingobium sp.]|uniref:hypothetical protein n=1 Tax=Novosphingobium sp. TaxID=1874826 RepID=UPI0035AE7A67
MSTVSQFFQPPLYWQQFEELAAGMLREVYDIANAQQYGRPGQAQDGVDVYGKSRRYGMIGIQCKRLADLDENGNPYPGGPVNRKFLRDAADESLAFSPSLSLWILATTARRDTKVQGFVEELNKDWAAAGHDRTAMVWSWDECISYLNSFPPLQQWYYRDVIQVRNARDLDEMILQVIATAFHRPAFEVPLHCETTDEFLAALSDTQRALRTGELLDRQSRHVIRKSIGGWREIRNSGWRDAMGEVDKRLREFRSRLTQGLNEGQIRRVYNFLDFRDHRLAHELDDMRRGCVREVNHVLRAAGIHPIP